MSRITCVGLWRKERFDWHGFVTGLEQRIFSWMVNLRRALPSAQARGCWEFAPRRGKNRDIQIISYGAYIHVIATYYRSQTAVSRQGRRLSVPGNSPQFCFYNKSQAHHRAWRFHCDWYGTARTLLSSHSEGDDNKVGAVPYQSQWKRHTPRRE